MTAAYLAKVLGSSVSITVLEAPAIPRIGVGEATIPNLQTAFFDFLGIPEEEWMRECNASYKMGIRFINWRSAGRSTPSPRAHGHGVDDFYHLFGQLPIHEGLPLSHYWLHRRRSGDTTVPFDRLCYRETRALDGNRAPRWYDGRRAANYAWHFDAQLVADYLCRFATQRHSVRHIEGVMEHVSINDRGHIESITTTDGAAIAGDLFVDCSGFRGLLINKALGEPFIDMNDHLLCDSAVATALPHDDDKHGVEPYTSSIAMSSGWTWKIPMLTRFGTGYVYASQFASRDEATEEFCSLWGLDPETVPLNHIRFRVGRNRRAWVNNCVGIGLASCFVEPLESTGIYFIYGALYQLVKHFPDRTFNPVLAERFNTEIATMFDDTRDFIQAHFHYSPRMDTPFWKANKELRLAPQFIEKIAMYKAGLPVNMPSVDADSYYHNFDEEFRNFWTNSNYYCVLAGLGLLPDGVPILAHRDAAVAAAELEFARIQQEQDELAGSLPSAVDYLRRLHGADRPRTEVGA